MGEILVAPSILAADFCDIGGAIRRIEDSGADYVHIDVMDGRFVPNITFGQAMTAAIRARTQLTLDVHLMIAEPERYVEEFIQAGADIVTVHLEACGHLQRTLARIRERSAKAGVALNPATTLDGLKYVWDDVDMLLIMSVNPGFGGQRFIPAVMEKIRHARGVFGGRIEVDGGVTGDTARAIAMAGADVLVAGSAFFGAGDARAFVSGLKGLA